MATSKDEEIRRVDFQHEESEVQNDELGKLLNECRQNGNESNTATRLTTNYSTTNFAYGVFDSRGGNLSVGRGDVKLFIPEGAIASTQEVYIYIDPKAEYEDNRNEKNNTTRVAPIVQCGPPGTRFLSHVVLTIPHNAEDEDKWRFTPVRSEGNRHYNAWQNVGDGGDDDDVVVVDNGVCIFMVRHFTRFTVLNHILR